MNSPQQACQFTKNSSMVPLLRQEVIRKIREFFLCRRFVEVDTPVAVAAPLMESYIDNYRVDTAFLRPSPELHMKRMLAEGYHKIFQIGKCFRKGETSKKHMPEFCMLEWYRAGGDYFSILKDIQSLTQDSAAALHEVFDTTASKQLCEYFQAPWECIALDDVFERRTGRTVDETLGSGEFEKLFENEVVQWLGREKPTVLFDFPAVLGGLARPKETACSRVERWELFVEGMEIVNAYNEITDIAALRKQMQNVCSIREKEGRELYPEDKNFVEMVEKELFPESAGAAMGVDRLLMTLTSQNNIRDTVAFTAEL